MIFLRSISDLRNLMKSHHLFSDDPVTLQIPELNPGDSVSYESKINYLKKGMGWNIALKAFLVVTALFLGILINLPALTGSRFFSLLPLAFLTGIAAAAAGKLFGVFRKKVQLKNQVRKVIKRIDSLADVFDETWIIES